MPNAFYSDFDKERFKPGKPVGKGHLFKSVFEQQREYVVASGSFHRLQGKTQVFISGEYDFYRTRLTHSLEVASIGRSICSHLMNNKVCGGVFNEGFHVDFDLVETICLSHDIGNPPFGHAGERVLHELMKGHGGFEGNAQSLRILSKTLFSSPHGRSGINPTRALLDGVLKYKRLLLQKEDAPNHFIYDSQKEILEFIFGQSDYLSMNGCFVDKPDAFQSIECQIMDYADDIANACFDVADGVKARFITGDRLRAWRRDNADLVSSSEEFFDDIFRAVESGWVTSILMKKIGSFVRNTRVDLNADLPSGDAGNSNRYKYKLVVLSGERKKIDILKRITKDLVFTRSAIHQIEHKGNVILHAIFREIEKNYRTKKLRLFPDEIHAKVIAHPSDMYDYLRDHISGMTDQYLLRSYKRLFDPDFGSISELV